MRHLACCLVLGLLTTGCSPRAADEGPAAAAAATAILRGRVERVGDGDSLRARVDGEAVEVRVYGIDAPELDAPFGREAQQALERRVAAREISLVPVTRDGYQRLVAVVVVDGQSVNEAMIGAGHAWAYRQYLGEIAGAQRYCELEAEARASRRGLWSQAPERWVPPWVERARARGQRGAATAAADYSRATAADCLATAEAALARRRERDRLASAPAVRDPACRIKGNINAKGARIYHLPGSPDYERTRIDERRGERWFCTEEEAREAGFRAARQR